MDFTLDEGQQAVIDLAGRILAEQLPAERIKEVEASGTWFADDVWQELAKADLLGLCLPEADGGGGYGFFELGLILEQVGRNVAPLPLLATLVLGALPIAEFGNEAQRASILPGVIAGDTHLSAALTEAGSSVPPIEPEVTATPDGDGWRIDGTKTLVPGGHLATKVLVSATTDRGATVFLVATDAAGVTTTTNRSINGEPLSTYRFESVQVEADDVLGAVGGGGAIIARIGDLAVAATCSITAGVCEAATRITGSYASERHQFGSPIATFQAVAHRVADAYIDTEAVRLTARQATWRLAHGVDAADALSIAKHWAATGAHRVVHAAQHIHGGIGVDTDYPLHRTYRWAKHHEHSFGSGSHHIAALGTRLAAG